MTNLNDIPAISDAPGFRQNEPLAEKTTLGIGGPAAYYVEAQDDHAICKALEIAEKHKIDLTVLGGGSNVLIADRGIDHVVLRVGIRGIRHEVMDTHVRVFVGAGENWDTFVAKAVEENWAGVECLSGIPGDVGAAPIQNIGAYGQEVGEVIEAVHVIERRRGKLLRIDKQDCQFAYRDSIFKGAAKDQYIVVGVTFVLEIGGAPAVRYAELQRFLKIIGHEDSATLAEVRAAVLELRGRKSMLLDPLDENGRSAGSFFLNPILDDASWAEVKKRIEAAGVLGPEEKIPQFAAGPGHIKLAAAWLIERCGFSKGMSRGLVGLSTKHTLAIVAHGSATAVDVLKFARFIRDGVYEKFGVRLVPEPVMMGFDKREIADLLGPL